MKRCCRCAELRPVDLYYRRRGSPDGLQPICKPCDQQREIQRREYHRLYAQTEARRAVRQTSIFRERQNALQRTESHRDYKREYLRTKRQRDENYRLGQNLRSSLRRILRGDRGFGPVSARLLGCSLAELRAHIEARFQPGMTWDNHGDWHVDHIVPLSDFDLRDETQRLAGCNYHNLQPLWARDNILKGRRMVNPSTTP
jgi:hypothetical protein